MVHVAIYVRPQFRPFSGDLLTAGRHGAYLGHYPQAWSVKRLVSPSDTATRNQAPKGRALFRFDETLTAVGVAEFSEIYPRTTGRSVATVGYVTPMLIAVSKGWQFT